MWRVWRRYVTIDTWFGEVQILREFAQTKFRIAKINYTSWKSPETLDFLGQLSSDNNI